MKEIIGRKIGMTQVLTTNGEAIPVSVIQATPNLVIGKKTLEKEGYDRVVVGFDEVKANRVNKPIKGIYDKNKMPYKKEIFELKGEEILKLNIGDEIKVDIFKAGEKVDITGVSKGKGFSGVIKRHGFKLGPMAHGSRMHRKGGSIRTGIGSAEVQKGKRMPGRFGSDTTTILNLEIVQVLPEKNAILVKGAIPGANKGIVKIRKAIKVVKDNDAKGLISYGA